MSNARIDGVLRAAVSEGLLPATAGAAQQDSRPWPVVLLTALGAWLAAFPLLGVVGMLFGDVLSRSAGPYIVGMLVLAGAIVVLRSRAVPLFVEQLAVPALWVGGGSIGFGLIRDLHAQAGSGLLALLAVGVAWSIAQPWLRVLLGAAAAMLLVVVSMPERWDESHFMRFWFAWHVALTIWLAALWVQRALLVSGARARQAAALESLGAGWLLATLTGLAWWSGMTFLVGASMGGGLLGEAARGMNQRGAQASAMSLPQAVSLLLAVGAALWAARRWPTLRGASNIGVALVLAALAWFMPALGAVLLALALCVTTHRWRLAASAGLAAAWIVGAFYYQLDWPLATKSVVLVAAGAALGGLAWLASRASPATQSSPQATPRLPATFASRAGIALAALATLAVANFAIWQKEDLIVHGQSIYVELAPVDPRSLMQGDFMRLNFAVPADVRTHAGSLLGTARPRIVARRDARGVATVLRQDTGAPLLADELRIELTPKDGRWILVSDAWFFKEGQAQRWAAAKYGEFRVESGGRALLVGLRGAKLEPL